MEALDNTAVTAVAELAKQTCEPQAITVDGPGGEKVVVFAMPKHLTMHGMDPAFDEARGYPKRTKGIVRVDSLDSFLALVSRFVSHTTIIYVHDTKEGPKLTAVINDNSDLVAGFRDHMIVYAPQLSDEWLAWTQANEKPFSQGDFASFLEDHTLDVIDSEGISDKTRSIIDSLGVSVATPAALRALARDFSVKVKLAVREARSLATGETQVLFASEHTGEDGRPLVVPGAFLIGIPVFANTDKYLLVARLRYRISGQGVPSWHYKLTGADVAKRDMLKDMTQKVRDTIDCLVVDGNP